MPNTRPEKSLQRLVDKRLGRDLLLVCVASTVVFTPSLTVDAFNPPKFFVMCLGVSYLFLKYRGLIFDSLKSESFGFFLAASVIVALVVLFSNHYSLSERLFGLEGRNFGFVTIICFFALGFIATIARRSGAIEVKSVFTALLISNLLVSVIFLIQFSGWGFTEFSNDYAVLPSTLGNPNFLSSFIAISIVGIFGWLLHPDTRSRWKYIVTIQIIVSIWIIAKTQSIQGFLSLAVGMFTLALILIKKFFLPQIFWALSALALGVFIFFCVALFGGGGNFFNLIPRTLLIRSIYWKISFQMIQESPFVGFGFDSYLDNFRSFLRPEYVDILGGGVISDSPHNLFLDLLVSGGLLLEIFVIICVALALFGGINRSNSRESRKVFNHPDENLLVILMMFLAVAFISPFQLSLFIWLPVILGLNGSSRSQPRRSVKKEKLSQSGKSTFRIYSVCVWLFTIVICNPVTAALPLVTEVRFRSAVESGNFYDLKSVALSWPYSGSRVTAIAQGMLNSTFGQGDSPDASTAQQLRFIRNQAIDLVLSSVKTNPNNYVSWRFLFLNSTDPDIKARALQSLRRIDPFNREWMSD